MTAILKNRKIEIDTQDEHGLTALHWAALYGYKAVIKLLVEQGADLNLETRDKTTPLRLLADTHDQVKSRLLLNNNPKTDLDVWNEPERTPRHEVTEHGHEAVKTVLKNGEAVIDTKDAGGETALQCAMRSGHNKIVTYLLISGAGLEITDNEG